ncbi:MAG: aspartate-semialdehyde dehydrogenase [Planctomycetota bacterium]|nr:aspartate-semialdehyde dehydrogenase [Planctomycetota bacterium]
MSARRCGVVGATGAVGRELLRILEARDFPVASLRLFASADSVGVRLPFRGQHLAVSAIAPGSLEGLDLAFFCAGANVARVHAPAAARHGCVVIDNSSAFRGDHDVPLVVPEVNGDAIASHRGLLANPNCAATLLATALHPLRAVAGIRSLIVATYQAASGAGRAAMDELLRDTRRRLDGQDPGPPAALPATLGFNVFPHVGALQPGGPSSEESKIRAELRRILAQPDLPIDATCVRVPVLRCHSAAVTVGLDRAVDPAAARALFAGAAGVTMDDGPDGAGYPTPAEYSGADGCGVGRIRASSVLNPGLTFWTCGDQLRKGAALNAVQIAEAL